MFYFHLLIVPISLTNTARDFPDNLLCIDNADLSTIYRLQGCPIGYFNTERNASGVCSIATADNGTDLLLTSNELVPGYHSFDCLVNGSLMVSNRAVVGRSRVVL